MLIECSCEGIWPQICVFRRFFITYSLSLLGISLLKFSILSVLVVYTFLGIYQFLQLSRLLAQILSLYYHIIGGGFVVLAVINPLSFEVFFYLGYFYFLCDIMTRSLSVLFFSTKLAPDFIDLLSFFIVCLVFFLLFILSISALLYITSFLWLDSFVVCLLAPLGVKLGCLFDLFLAS